MASESDDLDDLDLDSPFDVVESKPIGLSAEKGKPSKLKKEISITTKKTTNLASGVQGAPARKRKSSCDGKFSVEQILRNRQKRQAERERTQQRIKELKGVEGEVEGAEGEGDEDAIQRRFDENAKRQADLLTAQKMETLARQVRASIGGANDNEDLDPKLFVGMADVAVGSRGAATPKRSDESAGGGSGDALAFCAAACADLGIDVSECEDLLVDGLLTGGWLGADLHPRLSSQAGTLNRENFRWLEALSVSEDPYKAHHATRLLRSARDGAGPGPKSDESKVEGGGGAVEEVAALLQDCLAAGDEGSGGAALDSSLRRLHAILAPSGGGRAAIDWSSDPQQTAEVLHSLLLVCCVGEAGLWHDLALDAFARVLGGVDHGRPMESVAFRLLGLHAKIEEGEAQLEEGTSSILFAVSRAMRDGYYEAAASHGMRAASNALLLVGGSALRSLRSLCGLPSSGIAFVSIPQVESSILSLLRSRPEAIVEAATCADGGGIGRHGIWRYHDLLKMIDLFLFCAGSHGGTSALECWSNMLKLSMKQLRRIEKASARYTRVLASEMLTTYGLMFRS